MGTGKFTLYRDTHGKASLWFAGILVVGVMMAMLWKCLDHPGMCTSEPQLLGRFVVTPESARFVELPAALPVLANRHGVRCG